MTPACPPDLLHAVLESLETDAWAASSDGRYTHATLGTLQIEEGTVVLRGRHPALVLDTEGQLHLRDLRQSWMLGTADHIDQVITGVSCAGRQAWIDLDRALARCVLLASPQAFGTWTLAHEWARGMVSIDGMHVPQTLDDPTWCQEMWAHVQAHEARMGPIRLLTHQAQVVGIHAPNVLEILIPTQVTDRLALVHARPAPHVP